MYKLLFTLFIIIHLYNTTDIGSCTLTVLKHKKQVKRDMSHSLTKKLCYNYSVMVIITLGSAITQTKKLPWEQVTFLLTHPHRQPEHNWCSERTLFYIINTLKFVFKLLAKAIVKKLILFILKGTNSC